HAEVTVTDELSRLVAGIREAHAVHDVVEAPLERDEKRLAGDAAGLLGEVEIAPELPLEDAVDPLDLLLLAKLHAVLGHLVPPLAVLARRVVAPLDGALVRETALPLEEELHPLAPAHAADRTGIARHLRLSFASADGSRCAGS